jgi:hypothetical protein
MERGKMLFIAAGCIVCHGPDARGMIPMKDTNGYPVISRDLSAPWTERSGANLVEDHHRTRTESNAGI